MYLKTLTLKGFKSFLDRTRLSFDPGLSVVVGPNGSGKSNISDAILWVLGEQSAKTLRGQAMEDVIFAGSAQRKAVGVAEVTLVLDNADHAVALDFSEIAITRRMYRTGESEYLVNGAQVRLRDVRDLLHDVGLGRDTHTIISQGRLGEVLQSRPEDRRALIEEAAGIAKHRQRRERAERKLARLDEDIVRIRSYARILRRDLTPLERQVDQARAMGELREEKSLIETTLAVSELRGLQGEWEALGRKRREAEAARELASYQLQEKERELAKMKRLLEEKGLFVGDLGEQRQRSQRDLESILSGLKLLEEKGHHLVDRLSDARLQLSQLSLEANEVERSLASDEEERAACEASLDEATARLERLTREDEEARDAFDEARGAYDRARGERSAAERARDEATLGLAALEQELRAADTRDRLMAERLEELEYARDEARAALEAAREAHEAALSRKGPLEARERELAKALSKAERAAKKAEAELAEVKDELARNETELSALNALERATSAEEPLQKAVAKACGDEALEVRLGEILEIDEDYQEAIAAFLGDDVQAFVGRDAEALRLLVERAEGLGEKGRASFFAPSPETGKGEDVPVRATDPTLEHLVSSLFARVVFVEDVFSALSRHLEEPANAYLGRDGSVVLSDGRVRLGGGRASVDLSLSRNRARQRLARRLPKLQERHDEANAAADEARSALEAARGELAATSDERAAVAIELDQAARAQGREEEALERSQEGIARLMKEREEAAAELAASRERRVSLIAQRDESEARLERLNASMGEIEETLDQARSAADRAKDELGAVTLSKLRLEERKRALDGALEAERRRRETLSQRCESVRSSAASLDVLRRRIDPLHRLMEELHQVALAKATVLVDRSSIAEADSKTLRETVERAEGEARSARANADEAQASANELKVSAGVIEERVRQATERLRASQAMDLEEALSLPEPDDPEALVAKLAEIEAAIERMGPVNETAIASYERAKERLERVRSALDDLQGAQEALRKISNAVERKMRDAYLVAFKDVSANFTEVFKTLFGGGDARLDMDDPAHPLQSGVEVCAQPPRKRVAKMSLLSGGERALTALALLFAVYRTRTVPFYVFDEVEQALDDTNLNKLLASIDALKSQTQLIVISHQRRTMEKADVLYGVSMGADGVSRAISQRIADFRPREIANVP